MGSFMKILVGSVKNSGSRTGGVKSLAPAMKTRPHFGAVREGKRLSSEDDAMCEPA